MGSDNKWDRLVELAKDDLSYTVWSKSYEECAPKFKRFVKWCPRKIRNYLYGYAECGRMMMQALVNVALDRMEFKEEQE